MWSCNNLAIITVAAQLLISSTTGLPHSSCSQTCKAVPGAPGWPAASAWQSLNKTTDGRLLAPLPPAIVCDPARKATYDAAACKALSKQWFLSAFHAADPVSVDWPNWQKDACVPTTLYNGSAVCDLAPFPHYVVNATLGQHVAEAIKFASEHSVRLSVKGTGHDYLGRSTGPGLSIWTHNIRGLALHKSFTPSGCPKAKAKAKPVAAVSIAAGQRMHEVYSFAAKHNVTVVAGADPDVGVGGYITAGGHSPISGTYGLASDNVLEMVVANPAGEIVTANECQNQDLFWAMRGGGGSTFGVLLSFTTKAIPLTPVTSFILTFASTKHEAAKNGNSNYFSTLVELYTQLPQITEAGVNGYMFMGTKSSLLGGGGSSSSSGIPTAPPVVNASMPLALAWAGDAVNKHPSDVYAAFHDFATKLNATAGLENIKVQAVPVPSIPSGSSPSVVGFNALLGSRLWDKQALTNKTGLEYVFRKTAAAGLQGLAVSGPAVRAFPANASAVNPAWRRAYIHMVIPKGWAYRNHTAAQQARNALTHRDVPILRDHAPSMGAYLNEADPFERDASSAFWGAHYARLRRFKRAYDPRGVFWCGVCVGHEEWKVESDGRLCPAA